MSEKNERWQFFKWFCPNCGEKVFGYKNSNGKIKVKCKKCTCDQIFTPTLKDGSLIKIFPPDNFSKI